MSLFTAVIKVSVFLQVHRNVTSGEVRARVLACANVLSDALAATVHKTKRAAQQFPSVTAVQDMVDSVVDISHLARDLKMSLKVTQ